MISPPAVAGPRNKKGKPDVGGDNGPPSEATLFLPPQQGGAVAPKPGPAGGAPNPMNQAVPKTTQFLGAVAKQVAGLQRPGSQPGVPGTQAMPMPPQPNAGPMVPRGPHPGSVPPPGAFGGAPLPSGGYPAIARGLGSQPPPGMDPRFAPPIAPMGGAALRAPAVPQLPAILPPGIPAQQQPDPRLVLVTHPGSARATSFHTLRDNLIAKRMPRVLGISSAAEDEGKTTCAANLALSLSEGARVLLIDANSHNPALGEVFGIDETTPPLPPNLSWLNPYTMGAFSRTLHIAALVAPSNGAPAPRLEKAQLEQIIGMLRRASYDYVLIDFPAISAAPNVSQMLGIADATLLTVRAGVTTARSLRRANDEIPAGKAIGVALIDGPQKK